MEEIEALYERLSGPLRAFLISRYGLKVQAEDLVHEAFVALLSCGEDVKSPRSWLFATVANQARKVHRRLAPIESDRTGLETSVPTHARDLALILSSLQPGDEAILRARYLMGHGYPTIAESWDTSVGYARQMVHRAMSRARAIAGTANLS